MSTSSTVAAHRLPLRERMPLARAAVVCVSVSVYTLALPPLARSEQENPSKPVSVRFPAVYGWPAARDETLAKARDALRDVEVLDLSWSYVTDHGLGHLSGLKRLTTLRLAHTEVGDRGLAELRDLPALRQLDLSWTRVTDAGVVNLAGFANLSHLDLSETGVAGRGLVTLANNKHLFLLRLSFCPVDDATIPHVAALTQLAWLDLSATRISDAGLLSFAGPRRSVIVDIGATKTTETGRRDAEDRGRADFRSVGDVTYEMLRHRGPFGGR